jgi:hypothetical protein
MFFSGVITYLQDPERLMEVSTTTSTASSTISDSGTSAKISDENQFNGNDSQKKINWVDDKVQTSYDRWRWWIISNTILLVIISVCIVVILLLKLIRRKSNRMEPISGITSSEEDPLSDEHKQK